MNERDPRERDLRDDRERPGASGEHRDMNRDPITKEPGSHPIGTGIGSAGGAAAGAALGAPFGPIGALIGGTIGAIAGGAAGHAAGEKIDPTGETEYWRTEHQKRPYYDSSYNWENDYAPAYRYGWESRDRNRDRSWDEVEKDLQQKWTSSRGTSRMNWEHAQQPVRDAWERTDRTHRAYTDTDNYWRSNITGREYHDASLDFDSDYRPAYHYGTWARSTFVDRAWDPSLEDDLGRQWDERKGSSRLTWDRAKHAARDAWNESDRSLSSDRQSRRN
jgi:uncharacterized protein YcfJ